MAAPSPEQIERLGPETRPFERNRPLRRSVVTGEDKLFDTDVFDATQGGLPPNCIIAPLTIVGQRNSRGQYIWVIDKAGLRMMLDATPNPAAERGNVCHTNITGGMPALQGGELWFGEDGNVYINNASGRYGANSILQEEAVIEYFNLLGYDVVQLPLR